MVVASKNSLQIPAREEQQAQNVRAELRFRILIRQQLKINRIPEKLTFRPWFFDSVEDGTAGW
jgi:hypothetical protein